jgi:hypothetical protein
MREWIFGLITVLGVTNAGCTDNGTNAESEAPETTDAQLFAMQQPASGWVYFGGTTDTLFSGGNSAHESRLRVRYNVHAATQLVAGGRVKADAVFPDSSLIVKDLYTNGVRTTVAYMFKLRAASNAAASGWVWAETDGAGVPKASASLKGVGCTGCHSAGIDFTRMNDAHP